MKYQLILGLIMLSIFSTSVFASDNAPPPIPTEYWGRLIINGAPAPDGTEVKYFNGEEWIVTTTVDGYYNIILTGGDSDLTFLDDPTCAKHIANNEACIPCSADPANDDYCVEGPKEGDQVNITVNNNPVTIKWSDDSSSEENLIASLPLRVGWNMISLPILPVIENSPSNLLSSLTGHKIVYYYNTTDNSDHWKGYDSTTPQFTWDLKKMDPNKAYWIKIDSAKTLSVAGTKLPTNTVPLYTGWNMVGFQLYNDTIQNAMSKLSGHMVVYYYDSADSSDHWKGYDSTTPPFTWDLKEINIGKGYWVKVDSNQNWVE